MKSSSWTTDRRTERISSPAASRSDSCASPAAVTGAPAWRVWRRSKRSRPKSSCFSTGTTPTTQEMPSLLEAIERGADLVIGSRTLGQREKGALAPQARFGNRLACLLIWALYGYRYTDLGPFRAIRWSACRRLSVGDRGFGWTCEMQVKAVREGLRVAEVPVSYRRRVGVSKITGTLSGTLRAGWKILWTIARYAVGRRQAAGGGR